MSIYVTDTHPLIYYAGRNNAQLSARARDAFEQADRGEAFILIPAPALWEVSMLEQAGHIKLRKPFREWARDLLRNPCFDCAHLDPAIISEPRDYSSTTISSTPRLSPHPSSATCH